MRKKAAFLFVLALACLAGIVPVAYEAGGLSARLLGVLKFVRPVDAGGIAGKVCWATDAALPVRVEGTALVADPGSVPSGAFVSVYDGPVRLGSGQAGSNGSLMVPLSYAPARPVAVVQSASALPADWVPYSWERLA